MRPAYVAGLFLVIAGILFATTLRASDSNGRPSGIARRTRRKTAAIFALVSVFLIAVDLLA